MFGIIFTAFLLIFIIWILFAYNRVTERRARALNMSLFLIKSVDGFIDDSDLLNIFRGMHLKGWNRFLYGDPYISLEKVIHAGKTEYYVAIPKNYEGILIKDSHVSKVEGNAFPKGKHYAVSELFRSQPRLKFGELKLNEDEGVVLQILARHIHQGEGSRRASGGNRLVDGPAHFESNVRVMSWADSQDRAKRILSIKKIRNRKNRRLAFDFFSRVFENGKRVKLSPGELKSFLINKFEY